MTPASNKSIQAKYERSLCSGSTARKAIGNKIPVKTIKNSEIPSTPNDQEIPKSLIQDCRETNWNISEWFSYSKSLSNQSDKAHVVVENITATNFVKSFLARGKKATTKAPAVGTISKEGRTGKVAEEEAAIMRFILLSSLRTKLVTQ